jgi:HPt (histidine-containing phosphotransfer) domain-containing protein
MKPSRGHTKPDQVLDFQEALNRVDGDRDLLAEVANLFLTSADEMLEAIRRAVVAKDAPALHRAAHRLKGCVVTFAAAPAADAALTLELLGRAGRVDGAPEAFTRLETEVGRLIEALAPLGKPQPAV